MAGLTQSTIGRKFLMALSAMFLLIFLLIHLSINLISVFSEEGFNAASEFMGSNPNSICNAAGIICRRNFPFCDGICIRIEEQCCETSEICCSEKQW
jgi:hypothetical protein